MIVGLREATLPAIELAAQMLRICVGAMQVAGDLDLAQSRKYLTTCKRTYLKLRHLVDAGCLLVGHGLKKDFRMINIVVPPAQVLCLTPRHWDPCSVWHLCFT